MRLEEIPLANTPASFEPALDYVVCKIPRFPFDKFTLASNKLSTQMKATGEVMSVGRTFEESLLKAVRSLEIGVCHIYMKKFDIDNVEDIAEFFREPDSQLGFIAFNWLTQGQLLSLIIGGLCLVLLFKPKDSKGKNV